MPYAVFDTDLGPCAIAWTSAGLRALQLPESTREATVTRLLSRLGGPDSEAAPREVPAWAKDAMARLRRHLAGRAQDLSVVPLDLSGCTPFAGAVYHALRRVPAGRTTSYGELASAVGKPGAARAVGRAMAKNPLPVVVPCHRVLAAEGAAGGFSAYGGLVTKGRLLAAEGVRLASAAQTSLFDGSGALPFDGRAAVVHLRRSDALLGAHMEKVGPLRLRLEHTEGTFSALAQSIVYQQLSGKAAATIFGRVRALYPDGHLDPARVLATGDDALRGAGLSRGKLASLRDLAARAAAGTLPSLDELRAMDDEAIVERLTQVRGVGRWTVEMLLIFRLGRPDVLPVADYGIKKGFARVFARARRRGAAGDELPGADELTRRAERWRPFRSVASWYLWRALD